VVDGEVDRGPGGRRPVVSDDEHALHWAAQAGTAP
jgi:hypothetical protein